MSKQTQANEPHPQHEIGKMEKFMINRGYHGN